MKPDFYKDLEQQHIKAGKSVQDANKDNKQFTDFRGRRYDKDPGHRLRLVKNS